VRNKLARFAEIKQRQNVLEAGKPLLEEIKGFWHSKFFQNQQPITLELACGRGEYTVGLGRLFPERNFIGVDIKGDRLFYGSRLAEEEGLLNVGFLRIMISDLESFFSPGEVAQIWITFPDPRPRDRDEKRRLTHPRFLKMYQNIMLDGGWLHLKTDDRDFFDYSLEMLQQFPIEELSWTYDLYSTSLLQDHYGLQTTYESRYLKEGRKINYLRCRMRKQYDQ
jgi:tRNA (guanine-N7-)-methyltransferase